MSAGRTVKENAVAAELEAIHREHGGLRPDVVVRWAHRHPKSALHGRFTWDDTKAAREFRLWQARQIITEVEVTYPDGKVRQLYVSPVASRRTTGYASLVEVMSDAEKRAAFLADALAEYERAGEKYHDLEELAEVRSAVKRAGAVGRRDKKSAA